ncbi:MAG: hypothetical protein PHX47_04405 [Candidatus ainarchaeum sp.]|nr:hypothetical protein [Candidatus ainarchaeum sp.]
MGGSSGQNNNGDYNSYFGYRSGQFSSGSGNIFIGSFTGYSETGSNKLFIDYDPSGNARTDEATARKESMIYGVFNATVASQSITFNAGNVYLPYDNEKLIFGTGNDASIYYNGTNMIINPKEVGAGHVQINDVLCLNSITSDPASPTDGSIWYRSDTDEFRVRVNGTSYKLPVEVI